MVCPMAMSDQHTPSVTPELVVTDDFVLDGVHEGPVRVKRGELELVGELRGRLRLHVGARTVVRGLLVGELVVAPGVCARVFGTIRGTVIIEPAGELVLEQSAQLTGAVENAGHVLVRGLLAGPVRGAGTVVTEGSGCVESAAQTAEDSETA